MGGDDRGSGLQKNREKYERSQYVIENKEGRSQNDARNAPKTKPMWRAEYLDHTENTGRYRDAPVPAEVSGTSRKIIK